MADELERLFRALVLRIRDTRPENLSRPFEVAEILRTFVPYRATRVEVGVDSAEDYEVVVLRLLSGERGLVFADDVLQDDLRRELDSGNPDLRALQAYGTAKATLAQHAMRQVLESAPATAAPATAAATTAVATSLPATPTAVPPTRPAAPPAAKPVEAPDVGAAGVAPVPTGQAQVSALEALRQKLPPTLAQLGEALSEVPDAKSRPAFQSRTSRIPDPTAETPARAARPGCRFCGQALPDAREVTFCPHCGQNLKVKRCPGCSADIESGWKFCVTCGRASAD